MATTQGSPGIRGRCILGNFAVAAQALPFLITLRQRFRIHSRELCRLSGARPAGDIEQSNRCCLVSLWLAREVISATPFRIDRRGLVAARVLLHQNIDVELSHRAYVESIVAFEILLHVDEFYGL